MSIGGAIRSSRRRFVSEPHLVHAVVSILVALMATLYALLGNDHSGNVWIIYGGIAGGSSAALGRANPAIARSRLDDDGADG